MQSAEVPSRKWTLATVFSIVFLDQLGIGIIIPILAPLFFDSAVGLFGGADLAMRARILGFLIAAYPLAQFIGAPILGALSDRHGRKPVLLLSVAGTTIGWLLFGLGILWGNLWVLFVARILDGFTGGNIAIANSAVADISTAEDKVRNFGLVSAAYGLGFILGPYTGGKLSDPAILPWFTYTTPFWVAAAVSVANLVLIASVFRETLRKRLATPMSPLTGFRNVAKAFALPNARAIMITIFLLWSGFNAFVQFFQVYLIEYFGITQRAMGGLFAYIGVWFGLTQAFGARWVSRYLSPRTLLAIAMPVLGAIIAMHLMPRQFWMYYALLPFLAVTMGLIIPNMSAIVSGLADDKSQGEMIGIQHSMQSLGLVIPPIVSGVLLAWNVALPVLVGAGLVYMAWLVYLLWFQHAPDSIYHEV